VSILPFEAKALLKLFCH